MNATDLEKEKVKIDFSYAVDPAESARAIIEARASALRAAAATYTQVQAAVDTASRFSAQIEELRLAATNALSNLSVAADLYNEANEDFEALLDTIDTIS